MAIISIPIIILLLVLVGGYYACKNPKTCMEVCGDMDCETDTTTRTTEVKKCTACGLKESGLGQTCMCGQGNERTYV